MGAASARRRSAASQDDSAEVAANRPRSALGGRGVDLRRRLRQGQRRPGGRRGAVEAAPASSTLTLPSEAIVSRFDARSARLGRPRSQHDGGDRQADGARRLDRQQGVVDRAEPGGGSDYDGSPRSTARSAHQVARAQRDESARRLPHRSARRHSPPQRRREPQAPGVDLLAGQLGGQVRRGRGP